MNANEDTLKDVEESSKPPAEQPTEASAEDGEFKVTVRKLDVPVRPRGVLAE